MHEKVWSDSVNFWCKIAFTCIVTVGFMPTPILVVQLPWRNEVLNSSIRNLEKASRLLSFYHLFQESPKYTEKKLRGSVGHAIFSFCAWFRAVSVFPYWKKKMLPRGKFFSSLPSLYPNFLFVPRNNHKAVTVSVKKKSELSVIPHSVTWASSWTSRSFLSFVFFFASHFVLIRAPKTPEIM